MLIQINNKLASSFVFATIFCFTCIVCNSAKSQDSLANVYPTTSQQIKFKKLKGDSLAIHSEIQFFGNKNQTFSHISGIEIDDKNIYISDSKQNSVFVFNRMTYAYEKTIGSQIEDAPDYLGEIFGVHTWNNKLMIGSRIKPNLFKVFSKSGEFVSNIKTRTPILWGIPYDINNSFFNDSTAFVVKLFADKGFKALRLQLSDEFEQVGTEILPVKDFHTKVDSATASLLLTKLFILKSNLSNHFFALPANKFLVNSYNMKGERLSSVDLRGIPEVRFAYEQAQKLDINISFNTTYQNPTDIAGANISNERKELKGLNVYYSAVTSDQSDHIYLPVQIMLNPEVLKARQNDQLKVKTYILQIDLTKNEYKLHRIIDMPAAPMKVIDGNLWTYDIVLSKFIIFKLPK